MNCKLEKFWNFKLNLSRLVSSEWTVNLKSFEIWTHLDFLLTFVLWTVNLKSFEICVKALQFRLEEDITLYLKATPKPTFADVDPLKAVILTRCKQFERMKALIEDKTVVDIVPLEEIPKNDILNGKLTGVKITVYYAYGIRELSADLFFEV